MNPPESSAHRHDAGPQRAAAGEGAVRDEQREGGPPQPVRLMRPQVEHAHPGTASIARRRQVIQAAGGHGADVGVGDPSGADPYRVGVGFNPDERHPGAGGGVGGDQLAGRAAVPGAVAEHHVHLLGFIEPHGDPVGEQVPDGQHVLARVLQGSDHAVADRAALGGEGGQGGHDPLAELAVGLVGGQERDLIDQDHGERVLPGRGVVSLPSGERRRRGPACRRRPGRACRRRRPGRRRRRRRCRR